MLLRYHRARIRADEPMLWLKAFHVFGVIAWFAGLFYLPRLFVYHADAADRISLERFVVMERRLFMMMNLGAFLAIVFGASMLLAVPGYLATGWLRLKLVLVAALIAYHLVCGKLLRDFAAGRNHRSARWYRVFNEVPALLLLGVVILAVVKPSF
jgi:putative membrane protein